MKFVAERKAVVQHELRGFSKALRVVLLRFCPFIKDTFHRKIEILSIVKKKLKRHVVSRGNGGTIREPWTEKKMKNWPRWMNWNRIYIDLLSLCRFPFKQKQVRIIESRLAAWFLPSSDCRFNIGSRCFFNLIRPSRWNAGCQPFAFR